MPEQVVSVATTAPSEVAAAAAGWYGKLPGLGDFAMRRLPPNFVERWDAWLQAGLQDMPHARRASDDGALAPVRRFWLSPGVVDALAEKGVIGGVAMSRLNPRAGMDDVLSACATEMNTDADIAKFGTALAEVL